MSVLIHGWKELPRDIVHTIFSYLKPPYEQAACSSVCKSWFGHHVVYVRGTLSTALEEIVNKILEKLRYELLGTRFMEIDSHLDPDCITEALTPDAASFIHTCRKESRAKYRWQALVKFRNGCERAIRANASRFSPEDLAGLKENFTALARAMPSFATVREAKGLASVRKAFVQAVRALCNSASHNFDLEPKKKESILFRTIIEVLLQKGQAYTLHDLLPALKTSTQTAIIGSVQSSRIPNLLAFKLAKARWTCISENPAVERARELISCREFRETAPICLIRTYKLDHSQSLEVVVDALFKAGRMEELTTLCVQKGKYHHISFKLLLGLLQRLLSDSKEKLAMRIFEKYFFLIHPDGLVLGDLLDNTAKCFYAPFVHMLVQYDKRKQALSLFKDDHYTDSWGKFDPLSDSDCLTLLDWFLEAKLPVHEFDCHRVATRFLKKGRLDEALKFARYIGDRPSRKELLCEIAEKAAIKGELSLAISINHEAKSAHDSHLRRALSEAAGTVELVWKRIWHK